MYNQRNALHPLNSQPPTEPLPAWDQWLKKSLPLYGHRNWLVVADSAYPAQSRDGIETIALNASQESVIERVLATLHSCNHVRPIIYTDRELAFVLEEDAPGIGKYRDWLAEVIHDFDCKSSPHEEIISRLDQAAQTFCITIFKTNMSIPYTTIFFELDCAYWSPGAEKRLRDSMQLE